MAIPLIIGAGLGAAGIYKGVKALLDNNEANDLTSSANQIVEDSQAEVESSRKACYTALEELGEKKVETVSTEIKRFVETFSKIKNVDFEHDGDLGSLALDEQSFKLLDAMQSEVNFILSTGLGVGGGVVSGALAAYGAYSGVMAFGAASTGTAISSLSGVAATNATLAWLGGGSIAAGGGGVAAGTLALGALAAGPALLVAGWYMGNKAESKLNEAKSHVAEARKFASDMSTVVNLTNQIRAVAELATKILMELRTHAVKSLDALDVVISVQGTDYSQYVEPSRLVTLKTVKIMQVLKALLDVPILDDKGQLLGDAQSKLSAIEQNMQHSFHGKLPNQQLATTN